MRTLVNLTDADAHDVASIVPLSNGRAVVSGVYSRTSILPDGSVSFEARGAWLVRLLGDGALDSTFGVGGVRIHPAAAIDLIAELADGSLQGFEDSSTLRLTADGQTGPGLRHERTSARRRRADSAAHRRGGRQLVRASRRKDPPVSAWCATAPTGSIQPAFGAGDQNAPLLAVHRRLDHRPPGPRRHSMEQPRSKPNDQSSPTART